MEAKKTTRLVLTRKRDEAVQIDGPAVVTVHRVDGGAVRLLIEAERRVRVLRLELVEEGSEP